jgi:hypothetical protein
MRVCLFFIVFAVDVLPVSGGYWLIYANHNKVHKRRILDISTLKLKLK